jgi:hypothetical protein
MVPVDRPAIRTATRMTSLLAAVVLGCAPADDADQPDPFDVERRCVPPPGVDGSPQTIAAMVELVNALPMPVTLPCVLEALDRPLQMVAAVSPFSAQSTEAQESPRMFVFMPGLTMTVVPIGTGSPLLELAEYVAPGRSRKAELEFPVTAPLSESAPYEHLTVAGISSCGGCHADEVNDSDVGGFPSFVSQSLAPELRHELSLSFIEQHARDCDPELDPERCAMLLALFAHGEVGPGVFPEGTLICVGG